MTTTKQITEAPVDELQHLPYAQRDMREAYTHGYIGVLVSGTAWLTAALVAFYVSPDKAVWTLLTGGVLIHPISILLNKALGANGTHTPNNPLGRLAMEGTLFMIMCIPAAYGLSLYKVEWFFQGMLLIIGGRYLMFATVYGTRLYWVLGAGLGIAAYLLFTFGSSALMAVLAGALLEIGFALVMLLLVRIRKANRISSVNV